MAVDRIAILSRDYVAHAILEPNSMDIDVHALHAGFLRGARARGARIVTDAGVVGLTRLDDRWRAETTAGTFLAPVVVNAAGAWADEIAALAGAIRLGLVPKRRTAFNIPAPDGMAIAAWPLLNDVAGEFYFKVSGGQILASPADETPSPAMDAWADDMDVAIGVERLERATTLRVTRVSHTWAGLRTFAPDGAPVVGPDPQAVGFFWLVGQGGYGIKTSPALSRICASQIRGQGLPEDLLHLGIADGELAPARFAPSAAPSIRMESVQ